MCVLAAQSCATLCDPTNWSPPGFSVRGILQARILEFIIRIQFLYIRIQEYWIAIPFSRGTSNPGIESWSPASQADSLPFELQGSLHLSILFMKSEIKCIDTMHNIVKVLK